MRSLTGLLATLAILASGAPPVGAHTELIASTPQLNQTVGRVETIRLIFAGEFNPDAELSVTLTRTDDEAAVATGPVQATSTTSLEVEVLDELPGPGEYRVDYVTIAADEGLRQANSYTFAHDPAAPPAGGTPVAVPEEGLPWLGMLLGLIGGALAAALVLAVQRRRSPA